MSVPQARTLRRALAACAGVALASVGLAAVTAPAHATSAHATAAHATTAIPRYDHVVLVMEENHSYSDIIGDIADAPYINGTLAAGGAVFTNSFAVEHPSEPNYLDLFSGSDQGVTTDQCPVVIDAPNLGAQALAAGDTWDSYSEGLPSTGSTTCSSGAYASKHSPWVNFQLAPSTSPNHVPAASNQAFSAFPGSADFASLPNLSWVIPNLNDDMHNGTIAEGDSWLRNNLDAYAQWAKTHNSLLILTWDEDDYSESNQIPTIFYGANIKPGQYSETINHYSVLRTLEDMYGLPSAGNAATATPITDVFGASVPGTVSVTNPGNQTGTVGTAASLQISASDSASGQTLTYSATGLPAGLSIDSATGLISGTPTTAATSTVTVTAKDGTGASGSASFTWTVSSGSAGHDAGIWETNLGSLVMDDPGSSTTAGTQLIVWGLNGGANQKWDYYAWGDGTFQIKNEASGLCVDDSGASTAAGAKIIQWTCTGNANQRWSLVAAGSGDALVNQASGLAITASGTSNGSKLMQQSNTGSALQTWTFTQVG